MKFIPSNKSNTREFIEKAKKVHGDKFDYSKVNYVDNRTKICIICPEHGEFWQRPINHLNSEYGCLKCSKKRPNTGIKLNQDDFIKRAKEKHNNKYDYSKVDYKNTDTKVCIICLEHGEFWQTPHHHLAGRGCSLCGKKQLTNEEWVLLATQIHDGKYDYSKTNFKGRRTPITIICPIHGEFEQYPIPHLNGVGCPQCGNKKSQKEEMVLKSLQENFDNVIYQYTNKTFLKGKNERKNLTLDFYLPDYNIGIEYQGEQHFVALEHFGGEETYNTVVERDERKYKQCTEHGIKIFYISMGRYVPDTYFATVYTDIDSLIKAIKEEIVDDK